MQTKSKVIVEYTDSQGRIPFRHWLESLKDTNAQAIIDARLTRVRMGNFGNCRSVGHGVLELKIDFGPGYRVYFGQDGDRVVMKRKKSVPYEEGLHERLKDATYAAEYLNAHLAAEDEESVEAFLVALRDVATAHGIAAISKKADLGRESLYKTLSKSGNPKIATLAMVLKTMGLKLSIEAKPPKRRRAS